ncbi:mitochondrial ribosome-associated GTPase 2-like [Saccoglossus kowalevskii]|uniref:Mitochondrial ribosome-associated GTPase 2-like n=1 Tax=Saccoglossus kowalevskii TaxID=10224 RepID=A0ABM0ME39_SACKO|nr:PREDICTED: mitochondrial ribosome-associated GTPase 2-like [Saccoglossus kowalevskii]
MNSAIICDLKLLFSSSTFGLYSGIFRYRVCYYATKSQKKKKKRPMLSEKQLSRHFIDWRHVSVSGGKGGDGCISMVHSNRSDFGSPDGGNGGNGGHIIFIAVKKVISLEAVHHQYRGEDGVKGGKQKCDGRNAKHTIIKVPVGTVIREDGELLTDLEKEGEQFIAARGGMGGKGNSFFVSNENKSPMVASRGSTGMKRTLELELRMIAHAGLIGFPNAGKSSLLRALSHARPAVAAYPFTTLNPHVGIVEYDDLEQIAVADIPGLIRGAHLNRGLGHSFLRHIERCQCLLYVIDLSANEPWTQLTDLKFELEQYQKGLSERPHAILGNKIDLPESHQNLEHLENHVMLPIIPISAKCLTNIEKLKVHLRKLYDEHVE